jgi:hypothetical protein
MLVLRQRAQAITNLRIEEIHEEQAIQGIVVVKNVRSTGVAGHTFLANPAAELLILLSGAERGGTLVKLNRKNSVPKTELMKMYTAHMNTTCVFRCLFLQARSVAGVR